MRSVLQSTDANIASSPRTGITSAGAVLANNPSVKQSTMPNETDSIVRMRWRIDVSGRYRHTSPPRVATSPSSKREKCAPIAMGSPVDSADVSGIHQGRSEGLTATRRRSSERALAE